MQSFLQTESWMNFQRSLEREVFKYDENNIHAWIVKHRLPFGRNYLYIPHGPELDLNAMTGGFKNPLATFLQWLHTLAKKEKSIFVKSEPLLGNVAQLLAERGFKRSKKEIQPAKTVVLDLTKSEDELLSAMHHKTRYNIKVAEKHRVVVEPSLDVNTFWELIAKTTKRQKFSAHPRDYYKKLFEFFKDGQTIHSNLFLATVGGRPAAGALLLTYGDGSYYLHGGSDYNFRQTMAPYALHWYLIKAMKGRGFKYYDFGGSETAKWPGITRFKLAWGSRMVTYPGSFDWPISKLWYLGYKIARKIF